MLFIYWLENHPQFAKRVAAILSVMQERHDELITSTFTLGEVMAGVYRRLGPSPAVNEAREVLLGLISELIPLTVEAADHYGRIRGTFGVAPPDAIHLACAAQARTDLFLTNDKHLIGKIVPGIQFIAGLDSNIL